MKRALQPGRRIAEPPSVVKRLAAYSMTSVVTGIFAASMPAFSQVERPHTTNPVELTIHMHFRDKYVWNEDWPVAKELTRLTNIKLIGTASKVATKSQEQFNLMVASGKLPDIVAGDNLKDDFIRLGMEGGLQPLNKLIDDHAPHIKAYFQSNPQIEQAIKAPDGNIYYIPYIPDGTVSRGWWIRQDWLDKLNLKQPQNVDELYIVLKAFRDRDPNGNGKKDEIPYFNAQPSEVYRLVLLWGARSSGSNAAMDFMIEDGKVVHPFAQERFKTGIKNVAKWYAEGLIDKEIFTRKARAREQLFSANRGGMTHDWFGSTSTYNQPNAIPAKVKGFNLVPIAPPADINGNRYEEDSRRLVMPDGWAMTIRNKRPVDTIKLFDFYFSPAGRRLSNFGVEGQQYIMKDGRPTFTEKFLSSPIPANSKLWDIGAQITIGFVQDYEYERQVTFPEGKAGRDLYMKEKYLISQFPGVNMTIAERTIYDKYWPDLVVYLDEMAQNWVLGTKDVDKTWDAYQAQLKRNGLHKVLAVMQKAYDRQYGK
ncbi:MAG: extracellular solute-binding protein [Burkholderiales bacterium]|nr:extracellular solute-binding protein [Burkholderiales bacterium]